MATNTVSSVGAPRRLNSVKRSAFGTARKLSLARRSQSLRIKRSNEPKPTTSDGRSGIAAIGTVPFYLPTSRKTSASTTTPIFNTSLTELDETVEIDIPVGLEEVSSTLANLKRKSLQEQMDCTRRGILQ